MKEKIIQKMSLLVLLLGCISCANYEKWKHITEELEMPSQIFKSEFNQSWQGLLQVMKKYDIAQQNQEAGIIKTRWVDNTDEINFQNSFSKSDKIKAARFKLTINVVRGYRYSREVTKITVYKRQMIEQDFLQGWKEEPSDTILEKTILYRIGQLIKIDNKLKEIDKAREKKQLENF